MPNLNLNNIYKNFQCGKIDKSTAFNDLSSIIENVQNTNLRVNAIRILDKIQIKNNVVFKFLEDIFLSDANIYVRTAALEVMFRNFPIESLPSINWVVKEKISDRFLVFLLDVLWWSDNPLFTGVKNELYSRIEILVQERVSDGIIKEDALILVFMDLLYCAKLEKINYDQERRELPGDYDYHFKVNKDGHIMGFYFAPHSDPGDWSFLPNNLRRLKKLEEIMMIGESLKGIPHTIGQFKSLKKLQLDVNYVETIPESIGKLSSLELLIMSCNQVEVIPDSIGNLTSLRRLDLRENKVEKIPDSIGNLGSLEILDLGYNNIKVIPESIGSLTSLKHLDLCGNKIEKVPDSIGNLSSLEILDLGENNIKSIPDTIRNLKKLKNLYLRGNQIKSIPEDLEFIKHIIT